MTKTLLLIALICSAMACIAETLGGIVRDPHGLAISGAAIKLECAGQLDSTARTDIRGRFEIRLPVNTSDCRVLVSSAGFVPQELRFARGGAPLAVQMALAPMREQVDVTTEDWSSRRALSSVLLTESQHSMLSDRTQDLVRFAVLMSGRTTAEKVVYVDGLPGELPPAETIAAISVDEDPFSAEYADGDRSQVNITTKGGDRRFRVHFGGGALGAGGGSVLAPGLRSESESFNSSFSGGIPGVPVTFSGRATRDRHLDDVLIRVVKPRAESQATAQTGGSSLSGLVSFHVTPSDSCRLNVSWLEMRSLRRNAGVGGQTLEEAGSSSQAVSQEGRSTYELGTRGVGHRGGLVVNRTRAGLHANTTGAAISIPGFFTGGGAPTLDSSSERTRWTWKHVAQFAADRPLIAGFTLTRTAHYRYETPNPAGTFQFAGLEDYSAFLDGEPTGTLMLSSGPGSLRYASTVSALFVQKELVHAENFRINAGLRADHQSGFGISMSPRISTAIRNRTLVWRAGAGVFVHPAPDAMFLRALQASQPELRQSILDNAGSGAAGQRSDFRELRTDLAPDLVRARELMTSISVERRFGLLTTGVGYTWSRTRHLPGSRRLSGNSGWIDLIESNRSAERHRVHARAEITFRRQTLLVNYEWLRTSDDSDGFSGFPAKQHDIRSEWSRSAGTSPHNLSIVSSLKLPFRTSLSTTLHIRSSSPFNITSGADAEGNGLYTDRAGLRRNSGDGPGYRSLDLYCFRRIRLPRFLSVSSARSRSGVGVQVDNVLNFRNYLSVGSVLASPSLHQALTAAPGRAFRVWLNFS